MSANKMTPKKEGDDSDDADTAGLLTAITPRMGLNVSTRVVRLVSVTYTSNTSIPACTADVTLFRSCQVWWLVRKGVCIIYTDHCFRVGGQRV
jgi:hypothetical protein